MIFAFPESGRHKGAMARSFSSRHAGGTCFRPSLQRDASSRRCVQRAAAAVAWVFIGTLPSALLETSQTCRLTKLGDFPGCRICIHAPRDGCDTTNARAFDLSFDRPVALLRRRMARRVEGLLLGDGLPQGPAGPAIGRRLQSVASSPPPYRFLSLRPLADRALFDRARGGGCSLLIVVFGVVVCVCVLTNTWVRTPFPTGSAT